jgi:hypothetical protein
VIRQIAAIAFIFVCTTVAWMILGATIFSRTYSTNQQLEGRVVSTWGSPEEQSPPTACFKKIEITPVTEQLPGKTTIRNDKVERSFPLPLEASAIDVKLHLDHRQKGLLWYSTYAVAFTGDYKFRNDTAEPQTIDFHLSFPAQRAVYDGLVMEVDGQPLPISANDQGADVHTEIPSGQTVVLHAAYRSQGLNSWRYKLGSGIAQVNNFALTMHTNFKDIDFADDTLSPTAKLHTSDGWQLTWQYSNLLSGFQIGMTMPEKLQPGPLAGQISNFAPISLFFFFFLMFMISTLRNIDLHPLNYFFLACAFFAFHLLLAYLVDHISIALVVSYLRLVVGIRFAALEAGIAQLIYLVLFSYAFFWKGFTGLAITVISIVTLFVVMQATGRIRWSERLARRIPPPLPNNA